MLMALALLLSMGTVSALADDMDSTDGTQDGVYAAVDGSAEAVEADADEQLAETADTVQAADAADPEQPAADDAAETEAAADTEQAEDAQLLEGSTQSVSYVAADGTTQTVDAQVVEGCTGNCEWTSGWYVVTGDVTIKGIINISGDVSLILADGACFHANAYYTSGAAIHCIGENSFTVYGQQAGDGQLIAWGGKNNCAAIGGSNGEAGENITICGGYVEAWGGNDAAGIGGGYTGGCNNITIHGGTVLAYGGDDGAGIGGGNGNSYKNLYPTAQNITMTGGTVNAYGKGNGCGIGGGWCCYGMNVAITGGTVKACSLKGSYGNYTAIGGADGYENTSYNFTAAAALTVRAGAEENPTEVITHADDTDLDSISAFRQAYVTIESGEETDTALEAVSYVDAGGVTQTVKAHVLESGSDAYWVSGWYAVTGNVTIDGTITIKGNVHLILADGAYLKVTAAEAGYAGIWCSGENSLTIYGQENHTGKLETHGGENAAGIGGNARLYENNYNAAGGNITINGGIVWAYGGDHAAGIGGGAEGDGTNVTINAGYVSAWGGNHAAGIGGGYGGSCENITINGGTLNATGSSTYGIGAGYRGSCKNVTINAGEVNVSGWGPAIGGDEVSNITVNENLYIEVRNNDALYYLIDHDSTTDVSKDSDFWSGTISIYAKTKEASYVDTDGTTRTVTATVVPSQTGHPTLGDGWYVVSRKNTTVSGNINLDGEVNLILEDGASLKITNTETYAAIRCECEPHSVSYNPRSLTIYGQTKQTGKLEAHGGSGSAGIGANDDDYIEPITINGGDIWAWGGTNGAGIGGSMRYYGITINNGTVHAYGGENGPGIGSSSVNSWSGEITINGGNVWAWGGTNGAGIGGKYSYSGVTINNGTVHAYGGENGAGIGGSNECTNEDITINGGTVYAVGGMLAAGIGSGHYLGNVDTWAILNITFNGGKVYATGGKKAAGIGSGYPGYGVKDVHFNGGYVYAYHGSGSKVAVGSVDPDTKSVWGNCKDITAAATQIVKASSGQPFSSGDIISHNSSTNLYDVSGFRNYYVAVIPGNNAAGTVIGTDTDNTSEDEEAEAYYYEPVVMAIGRGITTASSVTDFAADRACTRAETVTLMWRSFGMPQPEITENPFTDISEDAYYYKAVLWAYEKGITKGTSRTTFSPNDTCTRAETVTFLWRAYGSEEVSTGNPFTDVKLNAYYGKAVLWAVSNDITNGTTGTTFSPTIKCTRGQVITFLYRAEENLAESENEENTENNDNA